MGNGFKGLQFILTCIQRSSKKLQENTKNDQTSVGKIRTKDEKTRIGDDIITVGKKGVNRMTKKFMDTRRKKFLGIKSDKEPEFIKKLPTTQMGQDNVNKLVNFYNVKRIKNAQIQQESDGEASQTL